ncbi:M24 family metallopeptidase [Pseudaestuariivita sp.]|uniref:M24 family metallopeptidase n=1 Tax=Pseudaestuariivita sp. TaxID=2211669 RepID=UPI0040599803
MTPPRGFPKAEFEARVSRAQALMARRGLAALLLTTEPHVRYFTGFLTRFWESPTRPWYVVVPASGNPIAVIPEIGAHLMRQGWLTDIRTWQAPRYADDGISLLAETLREVTHKDGQIGVPSGTESHLRMPLTDWHRLRHAVGEARFVPDEGILRALRLIKSDAEIAKIKEACRIAGRAFARVPEIARKGVPLETVFRQFQMLCLEEGADWVSYLAGASGAGGYGDVISPATEAPLVPGDVLMLDTGVVWDGYFCDFDRNYAVGRATPEVLDAHARLIDATEAGFAAARPGATAADVHAAMQKVIEARGQSAGAGRLGHGLGMQLTEWPSLIPDDRTELRVGMVLTLEPGIEATPGRWLVHEENIAITERGAVWLSDPAPSSLPVLRP